MRLLHWDAHAQRYAFKEFNDAADVKYAILSHRWFDDGDILFKDIESRAPKSDLQKKGWQKLRYTIRQAHKDGLQYVWIDTCCIDKSSSAELTESINSMYYWYQKAEVCYAYLWDCDKTCSSITDASDSGLKQAFSASEWFKRGWTLQELVAPRRVEFYGEDWTPIGAAKDLIQTIAKAANVHPELLNGQRPLHEFSFAQRMSWAAHRKTSRIEDQAYCMLGIFDVNMPLLYGEREKAFVRLQEEIIKCSTDHSLFAWKGSVQADQCSVFASSPAAFADAADIERSIGFWASPSFRLDNRGLQIQLDVDREFSAGRRVAGILNCQRQDKVIALNLQTLRLAGPFSSFMYVDSEEDERYMLVRYPRSPEGMSFTIMNNNEPWRALRLRMSAGSLGR